MCSTDGIEVDVIVPSGVVPGDLFQVAIESGGIESDAAENENKVVTTPAAETEEEEIAAVTAVTETEEVELDAAEAKLVEAKLAEAEVDGQAQVIHPILKRLTVQQLEMVVLVEEQ